MYFSIYWYTQQRKVVVLVSLRWTLPLASSSTGFFPVIYSAVRCFFALFYSFYSVPTLLVSLAGLCSANAPAMNLCRSFGHAQRPFNSTLVAFSIHPGAICWITRLLLFTTCPVSSIVQTSLGNPRILLNLLIFFLLYLSRNPRPEHRDKSFRAPKKYF